MQQTTDVLIHINEELDSEKKHQIEIDLKDVDGVLVPKFSKKRDHLLLVSYNFSKVKAQQLLDVVTKEGCKAQTVYL